MPKVKSCMCMFSLCSSFDQPLWNEGISETTSAFHMFNGCFALSQNLKSWSFSRELLKFDIFGMSSQYRAFAMNDENIL